MLSAWRYGGGHKGYLRGGGGGEEGRTESGPRGKFGEVAGKDLEFELFYLME